jgi:hypothetical protein
MDKEHVARLLQMVANNFEAAVRTLHRQGDLDVDTFETYVEDMDQPILDLKVMIKQHRDRL